jgi:hypothetical protein
MEYEKITITRWRISGGFILAIAAVIVLAANHKQVGPAVYTGLEIIKWALIAIGSMMGLGIILGLTYLGLRARRVIRRTRATPKTITLYPSYKLNSEPVAEIEPPRITLNGNEYVWIIKPDKLNSNRLYGQEHYND